MAGEKNVTHHCQRG